MCACKFTRAHAHRRIAMRHRRARNCQHAASRKQAVYRARTCQRQNTPASPPLRQSAATASGAEWLMGEERRDRAPLSSTVSAVLASAERRSRPPQRGDVTKMLWTWRQAEAAASPFSRATPSCRRTAPGRRAQGHSARTIARSSDACRCLALIQLVSQCCAWQMEHRSQSYPSHCLPPSPPRSRSRFLPSSLALSLSRSLARSLARPFPPSLPRSLAPTLHSVLPSLLAPSFSTHLLPLFRSSSSLVHSVSPSPHPLLFYLSLRFERSRADSPPHLSANAPLLAAAKPPSTSLRLRVRARTHTHMHKHTYIS